MTIDPILFRGDVDPAFVERAREHGRVAWDLETTGLDWSKDVIGTCQLAVGSDVAVVQVTGAGVPIRLRRLLADEAVLKVFHHAPFDLRFMSHSWEVDAANVACTKIASKVVEPGLAPRAYSLQPVLGRHLGLVIDKGQQLSDWTRARLSDEQLAYAVTDVQHLLQLFDVLAAKAEAAGVDGLLRASYGYLPVRVGLDLRGVGDVYTY